MFRIIIDLERQFRSFQGFRSTTCLSFLRHSYFKLLQWSQLTKHHNFIVFWSLDEPHVSLCKVLSSCSWRYMSCSSCSCRCSYSSCAWCWLRAGTDDSWSLARVYSSSQPGARTFREETEDGNPGPGGFHPPHRFRDWGVGRGWELNWIITVDITLTMTTTSFHILLYFMWNIRIFGRYPLGVRILQDLRSRYLWRKCKMHTSLLILILDKLMITLKRF